MAFPQRPARHILAILLVSAPGTATAKDLDSLTQSTIVVRVDNLAGVLADDLHFAEDRAAGVFGRIGTYIRWIDQEEAIREGIRAPFTIVLVNAEKNGGRASLFMDALGLANPTIRRAHVFYDRLAELNVKTPRTISSLLGDVIAHELGHLMLPPPGHSADGIMRPDLETKLWAMKTFTESQAQQIRTRLDTLP